MASIHIFGSELTLDSAPFIIAEAGINHNGELDKAFAMIQTAKDCGCDAVKFQTFKASEFCNDNSQMFTYQSQGRTVTEPMLEMFSRYEFTTEQWLAIKQHCEKIGIRFLSTPQNRSDLNLLLELGIEAIKVGSDDFINTPLIKDYAETGLPLILSCGMADIAEIHHTIKTIKDIKPEYPLVLCLCTSQYPTPPQDINLKKFQTLTACFPDLILGFSDHSQGPLASSLAVAFGAKVFEKHFTLDNNLPGPDHWFSENPDSLKEWVDHIRLADTMLGSAELVPTEQEKDMRILARRSIVSTQKINKGETFDKDNLSLKRPGSGLPPAMLESILGNKAACDIDAGAILRHRDITDE